MAAELRSYLEALRPRLWELWHSGPEGQLLLGSFFVALGLVVVFLLILQSRFDRERLEQARGVPQSQRGWTEPLKKAPRRPRTVYIPLELGEVVVDLQPSMHDTIHAVIAGTTGTGKSTSVLPLFDLPIGVLCVALDNTRPIAAKIRTMLGGIEWTNEPEWPVGLDLLSGDARIVAEVLIEGWAAKTVNDTGKYRDIAQDRLISIIDQVDAAGAARSLPGLAYLMKKPTGDGEGDRACRDWAARMERLDNALGSSLGHDLDIAQAMRDRKKVLLRLNRFINPRMAPMLGGMLLVHARKAAQEVDIPFVLIIEEAGQMGQYVQQITPIAQAGRDRGKPFVLLTQNLSTLPLEVRQNTQVTVGFAQETVEEQRAVAARLEIDPLLLRRKAFRDEGRGWAYVKAPGMDTTLVRIKQQKPAPVRALLPQVSSVGSPSEVPQARRRVLALPVPRILRLGARRVEVVEVPAWVGKDDLRRRVWANLRYDDKPSLLWHPDWGFREGSPCLVWQKALRGGRPAIKVEGKVLTTYRLTFVWAGNDLPEGMEVDHLCGNLACCRPDHAEACTTQENIRRRDGRRRAMVEREAA